MNTVAEGVRALLQIHKRPKDGVNTTGLQFKLHYRVMTSCLIGALLTVAGGELTGNNIHCRIEAKDNAPHEFTHSYCYAGSSTFNVESLLDGEVGEEVSYPGIGPVKKGETLRYNSYYMYATYVLFAQALMFYCPFSIWKCFEGGRIASLLNGLALPLIPDQDSAEKAEAIAETVYRSKTSFTKMALGYYFCNFLNLANVGLQIAVTDWFLGKVFSTYGIEVMSFLIGTYQLRTDPLTRYFPRLALCRYYLLNARGITYEDYTCVLPSNASLEKIYCFAYFAWLLLGVVSIAYMIYAFILICIPPAREAVLGLDTDEKVPPMISKALENATLGQFFILCQLKSNLDPQLFQRIIEVMASKNPGKLPRFTTEEVNDDNQLNAISNIHRAFNKLTIKKPKKLERL